MIFKDRVKQLTTTVGVGTYSVSTAFAGYLDFSAFTDGDETGYCCEDGINWEIGIGVIQNSGNEISRTEIIASSNGGSAVDWGAGAKTIYCIYPSKYVFSRIGGLLQSYAETVGECNDGVVDAGEANVFTMTPVAPISVTFSGALVGQCHSVSIHIYGGDANAVTWGAEVTFIGGLEYTPTAHDIVSLHTIDGGAEWFLAYVGDV